MLVIAFYNPVVADTPVFQETYHKLLRDVEATYSCPATEQPRLQLRLAGLSLSEKLLGLFPTSGDAARQYELQGSSFGFGDGV